MNKMKRLLATLTLALMLVGCADPAFQQYMVNRQAAIAGMPDGPAKFQAQQTLDMQILEDKREQRQRQAAAAMAIAAGMQNAANAYQAAQPVNVNVYHWGRY